MADLDASENAQPQAVESAMGPETERTPDVDEPHQAVDAGGVDAAKRAGASVSAAAKGAGQAMRVGYAAVRDVRAAARQHADARAQMKALREDLETTRAELDRRQQIEQNYEQIVRSETQAHETARLEYAAARQRVTSLEANRQQLEERLTVLHEANEEQLRPYRSLSDAAKGRADDAAVALAEARRALKAADSQVTDAVRKRDQRVSAASHTLDGAQSRLHQAQGELDRMTLDMTVSPETLNRMREEVVSAQIHLETTRTEVTQASDEAQLAVDNAQTHLWTQRQSLEIAERRAEEAKQEASARREEYDTLYRQAKAAEDELAATIKDCGRAADEAQAEAQAAQERAQEAQAIIEEANEIRATPEATTALRNKVSVGSSELERRSEEINYLARQERGLRQRTRTQRLIFFAVIVVVILLVILLIWLLWPR